MDPEHPSADPLLAPTPEYLASVKVCPLIPALKKDVTVSAAGDPLPRVPISIYFLVCRQRSVRSVA